MKILIAPKINPDLDGLACAYAYAKLLQAKKQDAIEGIFGQPHVEARYLIDRLGITDLHLEKDLTGRFDKFVIVDASGLEGMPLLIRAEDVVEVIDHRFVNDARKTFSNAKLQIESVGAAATLITERYMRTNLKPKRNIAILLYGAIYSNTLNFKAKVTHQRDATAVSWLKNQAQIPNNLVDDMFLAKTRAIKSQLAEVLVEDFKHYRFGGKRVGIAQLETLATAEIIKSQKGKINKTLRDLKTKHNLDYIFLTAVDLKEGTNYFFVLDNKTKHLLEKILGVGFRNNLGKRSGVILRKEIIPKLKPFW